MSNRCRSATDSQGTTTTYDARGKVISRESTIGNTTTIYDASGRNVGRVTNLEPMTIYPQKITFGEMRGSGVRDVLIYCRDYRSLARISKFLA